MEVITTLATNTLTSFEPIVVMVENSLTSQHSRRAYRKAITDFLTWWDAQGKPPLLKATVLEYRSSLTGAPASINLKMSAIRKLAQEASDNGMIDPAIALGIARIKGVKSQGVRAGNWLNKHQAQELLTMPDINTLKGLRDRAVLAVMIGGGLRRSEVAGLTFAHLQQRDSRWVIVDLIGKGNRVRTVPIPSWVKLAIDEWAAAAGSSSGLVFRAVHKGGYLTHESITPQAVRDLVKEFGAQIGMPDLAAHDLRRTFAKLSHKGGAGVDQIQLSLGHASLKTTEKYLGVSQDLTDAPCDHLGLSLE